MKIYAVGDSFTAGSELMDWKYYDDYPGYTDRGLGQRPPGNAHDTWFRRRPFLHQVLGGLHSEAYAQALEEEKSQTYAGQLGQILGCTVINHGLGGCSQQTILRNLTLYLDSVTEDHAVFLQPTGPTRFTQYMQTRSGKGFWGDFIAGHPHSKDIDGLDGYVDFKVQQETEWSWMMQWYVSMQSARALITSTSGVNYWRVLDSGILDHIQREVTDNPDRYAQDDLGQRVLSLIKDLPVLRFEWTWREPIYCPGGHFNQTVHKRMAEKLAMDLL